MDGRLTSKGTILVCAVMIVGAPAVLAGEGDPTKAWMRQSVTAQVVGLTFHPGGGTQPELYPRKLDEGGWWVVQWGGAMAWDLQPWEAFGLRAKTAWYLDCADRQQVFFHLGVRGWILRRETWGIQGGLGPTLVMREDWQDLPGYRSNGFFPDETWRGWQHRFLWYGGEFDVWKRLTRRSELGVSLIPGFPWAVTTMAGLRLTL